MKFLTAPCRSILLFGLLSSAALAGGGSAYSLFGIGELRYFASERSAGMGGTYAGLVETNAINTLNPSAWTAIARTRFSIGASYDGYTITDGTTSTYLSAATFNGFAMAIPIDPARGLVAGLGLIPYSVVNYNIEVAIASLSFPYTLRHTGSGGLSMLYAGLSVRPFGDWHLGLKFNYLFGTLHHITAQQFRSAHFTNAEIDRVTETRGPTLTAAILYSGIGQLLNFPESRTMTAGVVLTTGSKLSTSIEHFYRYTFRDQTVARDTVLVQEGSITLPVSLGLGLSYMLKDQFIVTGDFIWENWDQFAVFGVHPGELRSSYRFGLGVELLPRRDAAATYGERISYQFGAFSHGMNLRIRGRAINEAGLTGGIGLPLFSDTRLTLSASYSVRGTVAIERDNIVRVALTVNAGELWFVQPPEE